MQMTFIKIWRSKNMTSYDFEKAAKNAVRKDLAEEVIAW